MNLPTKFNLSRSQQLWCVLAVFSVIVFVLRDDWPWLVHYPVAWVVPVDVWINGLMAVFVETFRGLFRAIAWVLTWPMNAIRSALQWLPWPATVSVIILFAYSASGWRLALFSALALLYMVVVGYWNESMATLALVALSVPLSISLGLLLGIAAFKWRALERIVQPVLDIMQTFPTFAYLIPILFLFGFGPVVGLIASAIYAAPPMVRNVLLGLKRVPSEIIESGWMSGTTQSQLLWRVRIPAALATIMVGVNQTIMAALSMVIIASVIGSSADIGWEVLSTMRKAQFGQSFLAGIVIVLIAMLMDRISRAWAERKNVQQDLSKHWLQRHMCLSIALLSVLLFIVLAEFIPALKHYPKDWVFYPAEPMNAVVEAIIRDYSALLDAIKNSVLFFFLLPLRIGLENTVKPFTWGVELTPLFITTYLAIVLGLARFASYLSNWKAGIVVVILGALYYFGTAGTPWPVFIVIVTVLAYQCGGWRVALLALLGLLFILVCGVWSYTMRSIYLCAAAVLFSFLIGSMLGIWAAINDKVSAFVRPINDTLQTIPLFVFLIPVIMFFQVGDFPALLAVIMYAIVPIIRYTEHGIRQIKTDTIEASIAQGCSRRQILRHVQIPLALPEIMLGLNQTIMFALAMLVIAALVGTKGLGQQVYVALNAGNVGQGFIAGLSMALIAIITDRIIQAWSARKKAELGLDT